MSPVGQVQYYRSSVDGQLHPFALCATDSSPGPKPLLLEVSPGAASDLPGAVSATERIAAIAIDAGHSCLVLRPTGRGPGSVYQNYGEVDLLESIEAVASRYEVDRDRITITGASMGGAAVWYLVSHYPDLFAGAAPFCGYCDYLLWEKPGGLTFHMHPWEEPSWRSRSAALLAGNLAHTPQWIVHGEWDRAVGGGVPVAHSRQMARLLDEAGIACRYTEVPQTGHGCRGEDLWPQVIGWLLDQRRGDTPRHVSLATGSLRHNRSHWLSIDQMRDYGQRAFAEATLLDDAGCVAHTEGVRAFSLGPVEALPGPLTVDDDLLGELDLRRRTTLRLGEDGHWHLGEPDSAGQKRHGCSGPLGDLFFHGLRLVPGTTGSQEETFFNNWVAGHAPGYYRSRNGGVHRGGITGENNVDLTVVADAELTEDEIRANSLLLYGTPATNAIVQRFASELPVGFDADAVHLAGQTFAAPGVAVFAIFPHPLNPERYVAVHGGSTPDAICWGSHLDMHLLPDYLVYAGGEVLQWGFFDSDWRLP